MVIAGSVWVILALLFYLFFSAPEDNEQRATWYRIGTYIFQTVAIGGTGFLCLRNWRSPRILSGRNVWLGLGLGILSWGIGNLIFGYLDLVVGEKTFPSSADIFFTTAYLFLSWGMAMSVIGRRLSLLPKQWGIVGLVGACGLLVSAFVTFLAGNEKGTIAIDLGKTLNIIYAVGDVWLLVVATILLLAFWGGKASQSWRLLGTASIAMFIGDLGFNYSNNIATSKQPYQSGDPVEFFWILAFVLFGMGAALEHDLSVRASARRR